MAELLEVVTSPWNLLWVLVVFGVAPGLCLRLIVLAYRRSDPRRKELIAELYAVPRIQRPLWVAEQLEVALFEGLTRRVSAVLRRLRGKTVPYWTGYVVGTVEGVLQGWRSRRSAQRLHAPERRPPRLSDSEE